MSHSAIKETLTDYLEDVDLKDFEGITVRQIYRLFIDADIPFIYSDAYSLREIINRGNGDIPFSLEELEKEERLEEERLEEVKKNETVSINYDGVFSIPPRSAVIRIS